MRKILPLLLLLISCQSEPLEPDLEPIDTHADTWPGGLIPFAFMNDFPEEARELILKVQIEDEAQFNVSFIEYPVEDLARLSHGVLIKYTGDKTVQSSYGPKYGKGDYVQDFRVSGINYLTEASIRHEFGHIYGLPHIQQLANADEYLIVNRDNVLPKWLGNYKPTEIIFNTKITTESLFLYPGYFAAIDESKPTTTDLKGTPVQEIDYYSESDISMINELYPFKD